MIQRNRVGGGCSELDQFLEAAIDLIVQLVEVVHDLLLWSGWEDELHVVDLTDDVFLSGKGLLNVSHGDLLVSLGGLTDDLDAVLIELHNGLHHTHSLVQWAVVVVLRERVLLQELILDDRSSL